MESERGMGMTVFIENSFMKWKTPNEKKLKILKSWGDEYEKLTPFFVWRNLLRDLLEIEKWKERMKSKTIKKVIKKIDSPQITILDPLQINLDQNWMEFLPLLNDIHKVTEMMVKENSFTSNMQPERRKNATAALLKHILEKRTEKFFFIVEGKNKKKEK